MTAPHGGANHNVSFSPAAVDDLRSIMQRMPRVGLQVLALLKQLAAGQVRPRRLRSFGKTGDLGDCGKLAVVVEGEPEHRIVVRDLGDGRFRVVEVIAIEERADDLVYLLAGIRLGRILDPVRKSDVERRLARIVAERQRRTRGQPPT